MVDEIWVTNNTGNVAGFVLKGVQYVLQPGDCAVVCEVPICDLLIEKKEKNKKYKGD